MILITLNYYDTATNNSDWNMWDVVNEIGLLPIESYAFG